MIKGVSDPDLIRIIIGGCVGLDIADIFVRSIKSDFDKVLHERNVMAFEKVMDSGEQNEYISYLVSKYGTEKKAVLEFISLIRDEEKLVTILKRLKQEYGEGIYVSIVQEQYEGKDELKKKIKNIAKYIKGGDEKSE
jgi:hypothetical protein